jgi:hypothetical protein
MIAYWFPPEGNAAVYRPLRFLRNLRPHGWEGHVISAAAPFDRYDPRLSQQIPAGTEVIRARDTDLWKAIQRKRAERLQRGSTGSAVAAAPAPHAAPSGVDVRTSLRELVRTAESWWYHPDMQRPWIGPAVRATIELCHRRKPDVLWATGPPWSAFVVAERVAKRTGIPYVLDFRTSWTIVPSPFEAMRPDWAQRADRRTLRRLLADAQAVTFFYPAEAECFWRLYGGALDVSRVHVIPNGFDGDVEPYVDPATTRFEILYTGTLSDYGYEAFLQALATFVARDPSRAQSIAVRFVGEQEPQLVQRVQELGLSGIVSVQPAVPHDEVGVLQRGANVLLMLERRLTHKGYELLAGAKLFGYLKAGKPILGVVPPGEAARILRDVGVTTVADAGSLDAIVHSLEVLFGAWMAGGLAAFVPDPVACGRFSGRAQSAALVRALAGLPPIDPFVPGAYDVAPSLRPEFAAAGLA